MQMIRGFSLAAILSALAAVLAAPAAAVQPDFVMVTVNGAAIKRGDVEAKTWQRYSAAVLNDMVDDLLIRQAADKLEVNPYPKEIDARIGRIQAQFPGEASFKERLAAS